QTLSTAKAPAWRLGGHPRDPAGGDSTADAAWSAGITRTRNAPSQRPAAGSATPSPGCTRPSGDRPPANSGCGDPARSGAVLPVRSPADRDHSRSDVQIGRHTSELQSLAYLVCRLLLEKKN